MAFLTETPAYGAGVYQLETTDPVLGGAGGISNSQAQELANRSKYAKNHIDALEDGSFWVNQQVIPIGALTPGITTTHMRQAVLKCRMTSGVPDVLLKVSNGIARIQADSIVGQDNRLIMAFAAGFEATGPVDYFGQINSDTDITIATWVPSGTGPVYVYVERDPGTGVLTAKVTDKAPVYNVVQPTGSDRQFWFNTNDQIMYKWDGVSAFAVIQAVFIGQISRDGLGNLTTTLENYPVRVNIDADKTVMPGAARFDFGNVIVPKGYLFCDGSAISRTTYKNLFLAIGTTYGVGDGSTTFNLPDCRGEFLRGFDAGRGIDPARVFGSLQLDDFEAHNHEVFFADSAAGGGTENTVAALGSSESSGNTGGTETRPRNIAVNIYIKY